ncbi:MULTISPECIES: AMP-binding protein [Pseudomonas]|uniref:AMP-binding protein n=1 Tax=Pseudomonas TaxID=286 RepID=UPI002DBE1941|nr:AMP-binding protein [Pseudomonas asiatica]MEB6591544.1 AMP-binding protein [Pseudomonas asiatica]
MNVHEFTPPQADAVADSHLQALQRWARGRPTQVALRHRRLGVWKAWRWIDVQREVERLADGLSQQGFVAGSRLALSGAYEPSLVLLALAARRLDGHTLLIPANSRGEDLQRQLRLARPGFAFVQRREQVAQWLQSGLHEQWPLQLFSPQTDAALSGQWQVQPLSRLFVSEAPATQRQGWAQVGRDKVLWVDEGSEWREGLPHLLDRWLEQGEGLAFPETVESASRDRRAIAPTALLLSAERVQALAEEIEARLPAPGSWQRRLCDWVQQDPGRGLRRWLKARVRHLLGFQRLQRIDVPSAPVSSGNARPAWLRDYLERAA